MVEKDTRGFPAGRWQVRPKAPGDEAAGYLHQRGGIEMGFAIEGQVRLCGPADLDAAAEFAFRCNQNPVLGSAFCPMSRSAILEDLAEGVAAGQCLIYRERELVLGLLNSYTDWDKRNTDCTLLVDAPSYDSVGRALLEALVEKLPEPMRYTFFFPRENLACAQLLEALGARREVNEYQLLLQREAFCPRPSAWIAAPLEQPFWPQLAALHDQIFPRVYVSGQDLLQTLGRSRRAFGIVDDGALSAYGVLRDNGTDRGTAELIGVRDGRRGMGLGTAVLCRLLQEAFGPLGLKQMDLVVDGDNETAIGLYLGLGFRVEQENCCYHLEGTAEQKREDS